MSTPQHIPDPIERELAQATAYTGEPTALWRDALATSRTARTRPSRWRLFNQPRSIGRSRALAAAAMLVLAITAAMMGTRWIRSGAEDSPPATWKSAPVEVDRERLAYQRQAHKASEPTIRGGWVDSDGDGVFGVTDGKWADGGAPVAGGGMLDMSLPLRESFSKTTPTDRQVIRKASLDLQPADVHAAFQKASLLINEGLGEFIENSLITGEGDSLRATMTLRVEAGRISEVRQQLHNLGKVLSENSTGEDVTDRIVDLEARLKNERRVEQELLELFDKRKDAPLKEILELRAQIDTVRDQIEQLDGQRQKAGKLVALATILVNFSAIPAEKKPEPKPEEKKTSLGDDVLKGLGSAWENGLRTLGRSVAWLIETAIGGLIAWVFLGTFLAIAIALVRKSLRSAWKEPAPAA